MKKSHFLIQLADDGMFAIPLSPDNLSRACGHIYTTLPDQQRLDLIIWEDKPGKPHSRSFVGRAVIHLPPRLARHTSIEVSIRVGASEAVSVTAQVRGKPETEQTLTLHRRSWDTNTLNHLLQASRKLNQLLNYWSGEFTDKERRIAKDLADRIDQTLAGTYVDDVQQLGYESATVAYQLHQIRARDALISAILIHGRKYITPAQEQQILQFQIALSAARQLSDLSKAMAIIEEHERIIDSLGDSLLVLIYAKTALDAPQIPEAVKSILRDAVQNVEQGISHNNQSQTDEGLNQLMYSIENAFRTLEEHHKALERSNLPLDTIP